LRIYSDGCFVLSVFSVASVLSYPRPPVPLTHRKWWPILCLSDPE
jgi:hypothetical protein